MSAQLAQLLQSGQLWHANEEALVQGKALSSGFAQLDQYLPAGGWPQGCLIELLTDVASIEWPLLQPMLTTCSQQNRWLAVLDPPFMPYAPAWQKANIEVARLLWLKEQDDKNKLWALEQCLRSGGCSVVIAWLDKVQPRWLRRLQLAAEQGKCYCFLIRPWQAQQSATPSALRLSVQAQSSQLGALQVGLLKRRGGWPIAPFPLVATDWQWLQPQSSFIDNSIEQSADADNLLSFNQAQQSHQAKQARQLGSVSGAG